MNDTSPEHASPDFDWQRASQNPDHCHHSKMTDNNPPQYPVPDQYGLHRVRITERVPGGAPSLDEVRERVRRDLLADRVASERARRLDELVDAMQVVMEADLESAAAQAAP